VVDPYRREAWKAEARTRRIESRGGVPDRRPGIFEHLRHSTWLLWYLISVWRLQHLFTPNVDECKWQNDREGLHFYKTSCIQKNTQINCAECWTQQKGAGSQLWGAGSVIRGSGSQIRGAGSEIRRDPPSNLTPDYNSNCCVRPPNLEPITHDTSVVRTIAVYRQTERQYSAPLAGRSNKMTSRQRFSRRLSVRHSNMSIRCIVCE